MCYDMFCDYNFDPYPIIGLDCYFESLYFCYRHVRTEILRRTLVLVVLEHNMEEAQSSRFFSQVQAAEGPYSTLWGSEASS